MLLESLRIQLSNPEQNNSNQEEYKLLDQHWGTVFVDWATSKGGRLKSIIGDVRILPSQRTFTSLFTKLIQEEGGHAVVPQVKRMIKFLSFTRSNESDNKLLDFAEHEGRAMLSFAHSIIDLINYQRIAIVQISF